MDNSVTKDLVTQLLHHERKRFLMDILKNDNTKPFVNDLFSIPEVDRYLPDKDILYLAISLGYNNAEKISAAIEKIANTNNTTITDYIESCEGVEKIFYQEVMNRSK